MPGPVRVVLVDDHEIVRQGLKAMLGRHAAEVRIVGEAADVAAGITAVETFRPDVVLTDLRLGAASGLDLVRQVVARWPEVKVVVLTVYDDEQYVYQALRAGAAGYLLKRVDGAELVRHLSEVVAGQVVVDPTLAGRLATSAARLQHGEFWPGAHLGLSQRESEVLASSRFTLIGSVTEGGGERYYFFKDTRTGAALRLSPVRPVEGWTLTVGSAGECLVAKDGERYRVKLR